MAFSNIIFDFDGTLADSKHDIAGAQLWVLQQLGVEQFTKEDLFRHIGKSLEETFGALLPSTMHARIPEAEKMYAEYYVPRSLETTRPFPGVREVLETLVHLGKNLAIASTKKGPGLQRVTEHFGFSNFFVQIQGSEGIAFKPDPAVILKILHDQQWEREDTLMVGDTDNDILAGRNAGIATCGVTYGSLTRNALSVFNPNFLVDDIASILSLVQ